MTRPSTSIVWNFVAGLALAAPCCCVARTLTLQAGRVVAEQAELHDLNIVVETGADEASLAVSAASLRVPMLGLSGRVEWSCVLHAAGAGTRECQGPVQFGDGDGKKRATLSARVGSGDVVLELGSGDGRVSIDVPLSAGAAIDARLQQVPAAWLRTPLAQVWKGGEVRAGLVSADARLHDDGRVEATFDLAGMTANTLDGTTSADRVSVTGNVESHVQGEGRRFAGQARMSGGRLRAGAAEVTLPDTPVDARFDATMRADGRWDLGELAWNDADALVFRASGTFDPSALAPLQELSVHVERARFPLVTQRYAKALLESAGFSDLAIKGELRGDIEANATGLQRLAFDTGALAIDDKTRGFAIHGLRGGIDWGVAGSRPARSIAWKSARFGTLDVPAASSRWQTRNGALHLVGRLRVRQFGGDIELTDTVLRPLETTGEHVRTAFALRGLGYEAADGSLAASGITAAGRAIWSGTASEPHLQVDATLNGGEGLAGTIYVKLPEHAVSTRLDLAKRGDTWLVDAFEWNDPDALVVAASGRLAPGRDRPLQALQVDLHRIRLDTAIGRYAHSWLATKGYAELDGSGVLSGSLQFDASGLQRFSFEAHDVGLLDDAGRFAIAGLDGGVDWAFGTATPPTSLGWRSIELFRIPLGAARASFESQHGAIVLSQPLAVDVFGGQVRLEKLSLQPRSPRGERYAGSFAVVGLNMPQISAAFGWPEFPGNLSGGIPEVEFAGDTIELRGGLDLYVFDGHLGVSGLSLERPFGVAPSLGANIHFENFDLEQFTRAFSFGGMSGRLFGSVQNLRLLDWTPVAFDAQLRTQGGGRMSYKAVNDITSLGGGGGLSASLQTMALQLFKSFGYSRLGIRCRLADEVCSMGGIEPESAGSSADSYTIVEGSGLPRLDIVGHRRRVDWPTLVSRLRESMQGQGPVVR